VRKAANESGERATFPFWRDRLFSESSVAVHDRIEINPTIMLRKAVIRGARITVELILRKIATGADEKARFPFSCKA
jgi:hypothetical protein